MGLLLGDVGKYEEASQKLHEARGVYEIMSGRDDPHTIAGMDELALTYRCQEGRTGTRKAEKTKTMADLLGRRVRITVNRMIWVAVRSIRKSWLCFSTNWEMRLPLPKR
jgi:hypothetical protein